MRFNHVLMVLTSVAFSCATGNLLCSEEQFNGLGGSLPSPGSPSEYSRCVQGAVHTVPCANGQYFDAHVQKCLSEPVVQEIRWEASFQFEELCNNPNAVEIFPNPTNCSQYIICYGLVPIEQNCGYGLLFNPQLNTCDIPTNVICGYSCPAIDDPLNPVWLPDSRLEDCSRHYLCFQGNPLQFYCSNNLYFDILSRTCTYPQYSACSVPGVDCSANTTVNVANPRSCTSYYVCEDGFPHFRNCGFEEYFSEALGVCIPGTCEPGTTTTSGTTTNEPSTTTVSSETTPSFESTTAIESTTTPSEPESTTLAPTTLELTTSDVLSTTTSTFETTSEAITDSTTSTESSTQEISTTTTETSTSELTETTTVEMTTTSTDSTTTMPESTTAVSPSTVETTSEDITDSTSIDISTESSTQEISTTTTETSTSELTETTTIEMTTTSTDSTTTMPESTTAVSPSTTETTSEDITDSTTIDISTASSTQEVSTTTTETSTSELTETTTVELTTTTTEMVTIDPSEVCAGLDLAFLPYPGSCIMYIVCLLGNGAVASCAPGQIFNPNTNTCAPGNQETCTFT
ncbi:uncharacterized protein LOC128298361 [Anopheles moucheti]|uniref:uncharacterized protein LOC128298361 n=1 Tax=Anopheles moucheti TaxID=186751 RepID=UPI0022F0FAF7|nr:uncharacterized protein LOC128298361 [Anopheles moucheti]